MSIPPPGKIDRIALREIAASNARFRKGDPSARRAKLAFMDLGGLDLDGLDLGGADLTGARL
ncbi:MAG: pentapeptide repeat-containing protein, partial [Tagaea sp.]|nr:pentapeptide repeat-containing protein [Tagaea sp.]